MPDSGALVWLPFPRPWPRQNRLTFVIQDDKMGHEITHDKSKENGAEEMINRLIGKIKKTGAPIVVGLDPTMKFVPEHIRQAAFAEYGETLEGAGEAVWQFNKGIVDAVCDLVPAVKPQIAMYEQFGIPGLAAFKKTVDYCV